MKEDKDDYYKSVEFAKLQQTWYGWGSPTGLAIMLIGLASATWIIAEAVRVFTHL